MPELSDTGMWKVKVPLSNPNHPLWGVLKFALIIGGLTLILRNNASNFDWTEHKSILEFLAVFLGANGTHWAVRRLRQ